MYLDQVLAILTPLVPVLAASLAPYVTEGIKDLVGKFNTSVPKILKPITNMVVAATIGALTGSLELGVATGAATSLGFRVGKGS